MSAHALHNENACNFIHASKDFPDWVITTAFYSALHFVNYEMFPLDSLGTIFDNFEDYYSTRCFGKNISKHEATALLVGRYMKNSRSRYRWLLDVCKTARYNNYNADPNHAQQAIDYLSFIKADVTKSLIPA